MLDRVALTGMMIVAAILCFLSTLLPCQAAKLTASQIQIIQADIQNCTNLSSTCLKNHDIADRNSTIASSNFQKTRIEGFRQAAETYREAKSKFLRAEQTFDDAWVQMESGMLNNDLGAVQKGVRIYNKAIQHFNAAVQTLNNATRIFNNAFNESRNYSAQRRSAPNAITSPKTTTGIIRFSRLPTPPRPAKPRNDFPIAALVILLATFSASIRAFKNKMFCQRYILYPWSIVQRKTRYYTLISNGFIHKNSTHLLHNMLLFCLFAMPLEKLIGHFNFLFVYFGSLTFSSIVVTMRHGSNARYVCSGASGAISGVLLSYIIQFPYAQFDRLVIPLAFPAALYALSYLAYSYLMSRSKLNCYKIAHDAHLWGALAGVMITVLIDPRLIGSFMNFFLP